MSTNLYDSYADNFPQENATPRQATYSDIIRQVMVIVVRWLWREFWPLRR